MTEPQQHCGHECVCKSYGQDAVGNRPCDTSSGTKYLCPHDTRTHSSAPAPEPNPCEENGCTDIENCDEICQHSRIYSPIQMQGAKKQAAEQAKREERERIAKQIEHNASNRKYHSYTTSMQIVEYLRGEQP